MKQKMLLFFMLISSLAHHMYGSCPLPALPPHGIEMWDNVEEDIALDITILSRVCLTQSLINLVIAPLSNITSIINNIYSLDQKIASEVTIIDTRTSTIASTVNNIYSIDQRIASIVDNIYIIDQNTGSIITTININDRSVLSELMVIDTRTTNIQSNVNNIYSLDQSISSKLDYNIILDNQILSAVATLSSCCTNTLAATSQPFVSIYGSEEIGERYDNMSIQFQYGIPSYTTTPYTQGGGTVTSSNSMAVLSTTAATGSIAQLQSKGNIVYRSGHDAYALFTALFTVPAQSSLTTSSQFIGPIDYQNGFAVGFSGSTFGIITRNTFNNVFSSTFIPQSQFNGDTLNGHGPSGFTYNPSLLNVFRIDYGYLGGSIILFRIMNSCGQWITFHTIQYPNSSSSPSIAQPFLPITARVENVAGGSGTPAALTLKTASWNAGIIGAESSGSSRYFQANNSINGSGHVLTIRNQTVFNNQPNHIQARVGFFGGGSTTGNATLSLIKNGTVTGTSFSSVSSGTSIMQVSTSGSYTAATGTVYITKDSNDNGGSGTNIIFIPQNHYEVILYPGDTLTIVSSGSGAIFGIVGWEEQF